MDPNARPGTAAVEVVPDPPLCESIVHKNKNENVNSIRAFNLPDGSIIRCCEVNHRDIGRKFPEGEAFSDEYKIVEVPEAPEAPEVPVDVPNVPVDVPNVPVDRTDDEDPPWMKECMEQMEHIGSDNEDISEPYSDEDVVEQAAETPLPGDEFQDVDRTAETSLIGNKQVTGKRGSDMKDGPSPKRLSLNSFYSNFRREFNPREVSQTSAAVNIVTDGVPMGRNNKPSNKSPHGKKDTKNPREPVRASYAKPVDPVIPSTHFPKPVIAQESVGASDANGNVVTPVAQVPADIDMEGMGESGDKPDGQYPSKKPLGPTEELTPREVPQTSAAVNNVINVVDFDASDAIRNVARNMSVVKADEVAQSKEAKPPRVVPRPGTQHVGVKRGWYGKVIEGGVRVYNKDGRIISGDLAEQFAALCSM